MTPKLRNVAYNNLGDDDLCSAVAGLPPPVEMVTVDSEGPLPGTNWFGDNVHVMPAGTLAHDSATGPLKVPDVVTATLVVLDCPAAISSDCGVALMLIDGFAGPELGGLGLGGFGGIGGFETVLHCAV